MKAFSPSELGDRTPRQDSEVTRDQCDTSLALNADELKPIARRNSFLLAIALMFVWSGRQLLPNVRRNDRGAINRRAGLERRHVRCLHADGSAGAWQAGRWMDRAGRRPALATAFVIAATGAFLVGAAVVGHSFTFALGGSAIMGYGLGAGQLAGLAAADMYPSTSAPKRSATC